jgi:hypothetical protein
MKRRILYSYPVCLVFLIAAGAIAIVLIQSRSLIDRISKIRNCAN